MTKEPTKEKDITLIDIYAPNTGESKYVKQILRDIKAEINNNTIILGDINNPLTSMNRSFRWKINKETVALNDTIDQLDLMDMYRTFTPQTAEYTFFSSADGMFYNIDNTLGHKTSLKKFKKLEIVPSIIFNQNGMK